MLKSKIGDTDFMNPILTSLVNLALTVGGYIMITVIIIAKERTGRAQMIKEKKLNPINNSTNLKILKLMESVVLFRQLLPLIGQLSSNTWLSKVSKVLTSSCS